MHADEPIVQEINSIVPSKRIKGQKVSEAQQARDELFEYLRKSAIMNHNLNADFNDQFYVARLQHKTEKENTVSMYSLCTNCKGFYVKSYFGKHVKKCIGNRKSIYQARIDSNAAIGKRNNEISDHLQKVLLNLRAGPIRDIIENDPVIIKFGNGLSFKHRHHYQQGGMIRARLRLSDRLLTILRELSKDSITSYADFFKPGNFDYLFPAINEIGQYNVNTDLYDVPAAAAAASAYVKDLCDTYAGMCIKTKDTIGREDAEEFLHLFKTDYNKYVTRTAAESQVEQQRNKKIELPKREDLKIFYKWVCEKRNELIDYLNVNEFDKAKWIELGEVTIIHLVMFSGRRVRETERLKKTNFSKLERLNECNDASQNLSNEEKAFLQDFRRVLIRRKLNRTLPLLMTAKDEEAIKLYMSFFKHADVADSNPFVFALPGHEFKYQKGCDSIRKYTNALKELIHPERLRGTLFRKNISTVALGLQLSKGARDDLYDLLGHSGSINKNIYTQQQFQQQVLTVASILLKASTAVTDVDEKNCDPDKEEQDIVYFKKVIPAINTRLDITKKDFPKIIKDTDSIEKTERMSIQLGQKRRLRAQELEDRDYVVEDTDDDDYNSDCGNNHKRKRSSAAKIRNTSAKRQRFRWTTEEDAALAELYSSYLIRPITQEEIQKVIDTNSCLTGRNIAQIRSRFHKNKNTPKKQKICEVDTISIPSQRNCVPISIYNDFENSIINKIIPSPTKCSEILNTASPALQKCSVQKVMGLINKAIANENGEQ